MRVIRWVLLGALVACSEDGTGTSVSGDIIVGPGTSFSPTLLNLESGRAVTWAWAGGTHNVVFEDGAPGSGDRSSGTFTRNFAGAAPNTYRYRCTVPGHSSSFTQGMVGAVVVK